MLNINAAYNVFVEMHVRIHGNGWKIGRDDLPNGNGFGWKWVWGPLQRATESKFVSELDGDLVKLGRWSGEEWWKYRKTKRKKKRTKLSEKLSYLTWVVLISFTIYRVALSNMLYQAKKLVNKRRALSYFNVVQFPSKKWSVIRASPLDAKSVR